MAHRCNVAGVQIASLGAAVYDLALSPDTHRLAVTGADATIHFFQMPAAKLQFALSTGQGETNGLDFSPDSRRIAATGDDGTLRVFDIQTRREIWSASAHEGKAF